MAVTLVSLVDTFLSWMNKTNEVITIANLATEGQLNTSGTIKITNPSLLNAGVSLNVANGMLKGDGGLLTNVTSVIANSSIINTKLANSNIRLISNSATLVITNGNVANLGTTVYFDVGTLSSRVDDQSTANIASANGVNVVHTIAVAAFAAANSGVVAGPAFDKANSANVLAKNAYDAANNVITGGFFKGNRGTIGNANNVGDIFRINHAYMNANVTIDATERAVAVGPLVVNTEFTLTITTGGRVVIV